MAQILFTKYVQVSHLTLYRIRIYLTLKMRDELHIEPEEHERMHYISLTKYFP